MQSIALFLMIIIWVFVSSLLKRGTGKKSVSDRNSASSGKGRWHTERIPGTGRAGRAARSSDGHILSGNQDITCRQFGHNHPEREEPTVRYIVHDDIEDGYIILNGKKMHRTEADRYENTI